MRNCAPFACAVLLLAAIASPLIAQRGKGYALLGNRVVVDSPAHWRNWTLPVHAVDVTDAGVVPHRFRLRYNVLDDRATFSRKLSDFSRRKDEHAIVTIDSTAALDIRGNAITVRKSGKDVPVYTYSARMGISRAGSNLFGAAHILDGDPATYWEPDPGDALDDWWVEVDLGRVLAVDSVAVRFVDEGMGDPFRQFRILASPRQDPVLENADRVSFGLVGRTIGPNRDRRSFGFPLTQDRSNPDWSGMMVETLRIVVTESAAGRGRLIPKAEWESLPAADRGDVVYFISDRSGVEEPVALSDYELLAPERRGRVDYYIRERPRLADIEVWGWGDSMSPGIIAGGGSVTLSGGGFSAGAGFDGDFSTYFEHAIRIKTALVERGILTVDLGATFWLDAMRLSTVGIGDTSPDGYIVRRSAGTLDTNGQLQWLRLSQVSRENNGVDRFEHFLDAYDPAPKVRLLEVVQLFAAAGIGCAQTVSSCGGRSIYYNGPQIAEYQLFSHGYPAEVVLTSDLIELPPGRNFGALRWDADVPPGTELEIRTRTGDQRQKATRYFDKAGNELTEKNWDNLLGSFKGPIDTAYVVGSDWSNWSRTYSQSGDLVTSPSQRAFLQIQVRLRTEDRFTTASIRSVDIDLLDPVAHRIVAEVWPLEVAAPGAVDTFDVFLNPFFVEDPSTERSSGFDEILLTLAGAQMDLLELDLDADGQAGDSPRLFAPTPDGRFADAGGQTLQRLQDRAGSIHVRLPSLVRGRPAGQGQWLYHRITAASDQVPVDHDGELLIDESYGLLPADERGQRRFFQRDSDGDRVTLTPVDEAAYDQLEPDRRLARFFRVLTDDGGQFPFDAEGDTLTQSAYRALPQTARGRVVAAGSLMRLRFSAPVYANGAVLGIAVRDGAGARPWQAVDPGDATPAVNSQALSIQVPLDARPLDRVAIAPNPFTPNGDGVNDETRVQFLVIKLTTSRQATVRIFALDGRRVWQGSQQVSSGEASITWPGVDEQGQTVPPGIYICQLELDVDAQEVERSSLSRLVHVVY